MKMVTVVCDNCRKVFERKISNVNQAKNNGHRGRYCSVECFHVANRKSVDVVCSACGVKLSVGKAVYDRRVSKKFFCGHSCAAKHSNLGVCRHPVVEKRLCLNCGNETRNSLWCSKDCRALYGWKRKREQIAEYGVIQFGVEEYNRRVARRFLIEERGHRCEICSQEEWMGKPIPLVLDHMDGDAYNYSVVNLRMVCGNCNMLLDTFAGRNRGNGKRGKKAHV